MSVTVFFASEFALRIIVSLVFCSLNNHLCYTKRAKEQVFREDGASLVRLTVFPEMVDLITEKVDFVRVFVDFSSA